jgi:molybdate transport system substrate-binding protein
MNRRFVPLLAALSSFAAANLPAESGAADIICLAPRALQTTLTELTPRFEKSSGHKITIIYGSAGGLTESLQKGDFADLAIVSDKQVGDLEKQGKIVTGSKAALAKVGVALMVRRGAVKPDVSSVDAFRKSMLDAKSITHTDPKYGGPAGMYMFGLFEKLGIAADMKAKTKLVAPAAPLYNTIINGEAEIGFDQLSQIVAEPNVEFAGVLPASIQNYTRFSAGITTASKQKVAAKAFIAFLSSPVAETVLKAKGFEPF